MSESPYQALFFISGEHEQLVSYVQSRLDDLATELEQRVEHDGERSVWRVNDDFAFSITAEKLSDVHAWEYAQRYDDIRAAWTVYDSSTLITLAGQQDVILESDDQYDVEFQRLRSELESLAVVVVDPLAPPVVTDSIIITPRADTKAAPDWFEHQHAPERRPETLPTTAIMRGEKPQTMQAILIGVVVVLALVLAAIIATFAPVLGTWWLSFAVFACAAFVGVALAVWLVRRARA
ncbi:hypothetical protein [Paramicrobacterium agarici]|uniref:hypothetical protein n=1 Tax=Paramicrobacterium agarici TaxID=630514 RepID=UPI0011530636|nr:hypothetical protein [Microbacterium agarici]TQO21923.1 hypothetical protein FB385_0736 [Microbacterium agarici]